MASQSNSDMWMGAASSEISLPSNPALELEEETSWKVSTSSQSTSNIEVKENVGTPSFSKGVLDEEWYTPETSLMELSYSLPYGISDTRTGFGMLESSLNFDSSSNLMSSFRPAPSALSMGLESNRSLEDLVCTGQGSSNVGLLSSLSPGGQLGRSTVMESFSSGLPTSFNQGIINAGGSITNITSSNINNVRSNFPLMASPSNFSDAYRARSVSEDKSGKVVGSGGPRNELVPYHRNKGAETRSHGQGQQTLFLKRAASRRCAGSSGTVSPVSKSPPRVVTSASNDSSVDTPDKDSPHPRNAHLQSASGRLNINSGSDDPNDMGLDGDDYDAKDDDDLDESGDGSGGPYEVEEGAGNGADQSIGKGNGKGKRGLPAKNLMAERRRRKKLNDRLYTLRSVVPKITKMDRASILGDAIEYLKELLQRINEIHNELEAAKLEQSRSMPSSPTPRSTQGYPATVKEECPVLPNPESQPPRVEVRKREGQALNIHMFCARRPGLLLSTVKALDALGLDVQQAVISCFNGFALDLFRAEAKDVDVGPEEIKAVLLLTAGCDLHSLQ
ncbi:uncharacterized protein [Physcomitrium patens]|uniref:BHLH domain-containing protein n=1 Tax=Physcomitrium patens TaxID=3218 RepID=A0A7I4A2H5_PHYPA|nr:hyphally regulated cell wall protein 3-like isoform X2 [Physcomitrium patens]|eukprot:XP_024386994.1 hyphally regulated cell wall protein 3-like isoform X2 [Physcomitrella patens]